MSLLASSPWTSWSFPPLVIAGAATSIAFFLQGWLRLRRRGRPDLAPWSRVGLFAAGIAVVTLAIVSPLAVFFLPRDLLAPLARARWLRPTLRWLLRPGVTITLWLGVLVAWHIPALYEAALRTRAVHDLQHFSFLLVGVLVWVNQSDRLLGLSPLTDQKLAGVVMMVEQALTIGVFLLWQLQRRAATGAATKNEPA